MHFLLLCLSWLTFPLATLGLKGDWACKSALCIAAVVESDIVHYELTTTLKDLSWVGIGFGEYMVHTHSVVLWKNPADGSTVLSQRYAMKYEEPQVVESPPRVARIVEPKGLSTQPSPSIVFAFEIPLDSTRPTHPDSPEPHVFAFSTRPVLANLNGNLDDPASHIPIHSHTGVIPLNLSNDFITSATTHSPPKVPMQISGEAKATESSRVENLIRLHAFLVSFGFLVLLPLGALVARYSRVLKVEWFPYHWKINFYIAGPIITAGVLLGPIIVYSKSTYRIHFANGHEIVGILLLALYYLQVFLGQYIHDCRDRLARLGPITHPHPPLNILHIVLGVSIVAIAFCQIYTGMQWWELVTHRGPITNWALPVWKTWIPVLFLAYFGGYALLPRQLRREREAAAGANAYRPVASDLNGHDQSTPLLTED